jgi:hypothetical protein
VSVSGADSVRVRVHLYERCFRRKPVKVVSADEVHVGVMQETGGALGDVTDEARFCRTTATCIWGVSDPLSRAPNLDRRVAEGVAHAPDASFTAADSRADRHVGGIRRRPVHRDEVEHCKEHRRVNAAHNDVDPAARLEANRSPRRGNTAPKSVFPPSARHSYASCVY